MATMSQLRDDFTDNSISTSAWVSDATGSATVAETSGQIRFTLPSSAGVGPHVARLTSRYTYDLDEDSFYINIQTMVATGVAATAFFQVYLDGGNSLQWIQLSNSIIARTIIGGSSVDRFTATWSGTTYQYLRIRENAGDIEWHSSSNGTTWTLRANLAIPFPITSLFVDFGAFCGNVASPGSFRLDDVNLVLPALSTTWRYQQAIWDLENRHKRVTIACDVAGTVQGYLETADGVDSGDGPTGNIRYWSGPAGGGRLLTEQTTQAAAQAMAVDLPLDGSFDLPSQIDGRVFRLYTRSIDGNPFTIREFFPRRLVQSDDIEAESIIALHIAADQILAEHIAARQITAEHIDVLALDATHYITAGGGMVRLDSNGLVITSATSSTFTSTRSVSWNDGTRTTGFINAYTGGTVDDEVQIVASALASGRQGAVRVSALGTNPASLDLTAAASTTNAVIQAQAPGGMFLSALDAGTAAPLSLLTLTHNSSGTPAPQFGADIVTRLKSSTTDDQLASSISTRWVTATHGSRAARVHFFVYDTAVREGMRIEASGTAPLLGFYGVAAVARQAIGAAAPAGGVGTAAGGWSTAANRDLAITLINNLRSALITLGLCQT